MIPQGGSEHATQHRCPGEWITVALINWAIEKYRESIATISADGTAANEIAHKKGWTIHYHTLIENFSGDTSEFQRIMRDLGKFGPKISTGSKFEVYREVQHLFHNAAPKK